MKHFLFVFLLSAISTTLSAQGLTRFGQITNGPSNDFVDKYGRLASIPMLDANGKVLFDLTTTAVTAITNTAASSGGNVTSVAAITARGVCWSTNPAPTVALPTKTIDGAGTGSFTSEITGIVCGTKYYVRAYATNSYGTGYGNEISYTVCCAPPPTVTNPITGKVWMDRNLGASQVATSITDAASFGDLYQWGRGTDGHQIRTSATTNTLSSSDVPGHGNFIASPTNTDIDWRSPANNNLWQGVNGVNNPCPCGFRIPTEDEWIAESETWRLGNMAGAFESPLKLPSAGSRHRQGGVIDAGSSGFYWSSSTTSSGYSQILGFDNFLWTFYTVRNMGGAVRCIKD